MMRLTHSVGQVLPTIWEYNIFKANDSTVSFPVKVPMNPILWRRQDGTLTAGSGNVWVVVPEGTTRETMKQWVSWKPQGAPKRSDMRKIKGSKGNIYTLRKMSDGRVVCSCPGFRWRGKCKHQAMF